MKLESGVSLHLSLSRTRIWKRRPRNVGTPQHRRYIGPALIGDYLSCLIHEHEIDIVAIQEKHETSDLNLLNREANHLDSN
jgi:hypothetical protein